jgi:hypothetical protein
MKVNDYQVDYPAGHSPNGDGNPISCQSRPFSWSSHIRLGVNDRQYAAGQEGWYTLAGGDCPIADSGPANPQPNIFMDWTLSGPDGQNYCPRVDISTFWCGANACVAPGTITVTVNKGACPGGDAVSSGTADAAGNYKAFLPAGTYCCSATTTAGGYLNFPNTFSIDDTGTVVQGGADTMLYPAQLTVSDGISGQSFTVFPYGLMPPILGTGSDGNQAEGQALHYWGTGGSYNFPACELSGCAAATATLYASYFCSTSSVVANGAAAVQIVWGIWPDANDNLCPSDEGINIPNGGGWYEVAVLGTGPGDQYPPVPCYPVHQTGFGRWTQCTGTAGGPSPPVTVSGTITVSQGALSLGALNPGPSPSPSPVPANPSPSFPPITRQAANLAKAFWDFAVSGFSMTTPEERERRMSLCRGCENYHAGRCVLCGCYLSKKLAMRTEHCPILKW